MPNFSKIIFNGNTLMDVTQDTVAADKLAIDYTATIADGSRVTGTMPEGSTGFEHVASLYDHTWTLAETGYNTWTPSTTAFAIITGDTAGTFVATDLVNNDYFSQWRLEMNAVYPAGTTQAKGQLIRVIGQNWYTISKRPSTAAYYDSGTKNYNAATNLSNYWYEYYASSGTAFTIAYATSYGLYPVNIAPTLSSTSTASPTVTVKYPTINARVSSTYFATSFASAIDKNNSTIRIVCDIWKSTNVGFRYSMIYDQFIDQWQNGLPT